MSPDHRPPLDALRPRRLLQAPVHAYRFLFSPWVGQSCRFEPTCSAYMLQALERHGALGGAALGTWRILRCHPWCDGGLDPVPDNPPWRGWLGAPRAGAGTTGPDDDNESSPSSKKHPQ